jgi:hypothetical protein
MDKKADILKIIASILLLGLVSSPNVKGQTTTYTPVGEILPSFSFINQNAYFCSSDYFYGPVGPASKKYHLFGSRGKS